MHAARTQREDIVHFLNACHSCTGQREFYENSSQQRVSICFLHEYMLKNYRSIYAQTLACGVNHFNQSQIILNLLATGKESIPGEGALIARSLATLPPQRAWKTLRDIRVRSINNRRTRAIVRQYLASRDIVFDCVKYGNKVKAVASHNHLKLPGESGLFLFEKEVPRFATPLFEKVRRAWYSADAVYELPYTIAEGLATKHQIPRERFLTRIEARMTQTEKLRMHKSADTSVDLSRASITRLALYALSLPTKNEEVQSAMVNAASLFKQRNSLRLGKVAAVLDNSYSTSGTYEKKRRPLALAWAIDRLLHQVSEEYRPFWLTSVDGEKPIARGGTNLAIPILNAIETRSELLIIVSDAVENDPPGAAAAVLKHWRKCKDVNPEMVIVHLNPVFSASDYAPKQLCDGVPTVGIRDAENLPTALAFARFATGNVTRADLEEFLDQRVAEFLGSEREVENAE